MNVRSESALRSLVVFAVVSTTALLGACSALPRQPAPPPADALAAPVGFPARVRFLGIDPDSFDRRADSVVEAVSDAAHGGPVNVLALSGGGAGGAFGAGALVGMTRRGDRPVFHVVTGVSVGALLAPFAFLGPEWDPELLEGFADGRIPNLLRLGGPTILFRSSVYPGGPLRSFVDRLVTQRLVDAVADEAATGRLLLVATTDLDKQETVIWDLGAVAAVGGEAARALFRDVLVASASIPGIFPPVLIHVHDGKQQYEEMHVDGATTVPFFVAPEIAQLDAGRVLDLHGGSIFVLVNGALSARPITTKAGSFAVISRGFAASTMHGLRRTIELAADFAQRHRMDLEFSYIPTTYPYRGALDFETDELRRLFEFGARCAESGKLWTRLEAAVEEGRKTLTAPVSPPTCPGPMDMPSSRFAAAEEATIPTARRAMARP
jgi:predicted acylesterase/phospholipase RssA